MNLAKINFGPNLAKCTITEDLRNDLLELGKNQRYSAKSHLAGRIDKEFFFDNEARNKVEKRITSYVENYLRTIGTFEGVDTTYFKPVLNSLWINFQSKGESNPPHKHSGDISFVIYLDVPKEIKDEINDTLSYPNGSISFIHGTDTKLSSGKESKFNLNLNKILGPNNIVTHLPNTNDMFIFPAYLIHFVEPFYSENIERISVSGNISVVNAEKNMI